jgi:hypothetical protein
MGGATGLDYPAAFAVAEVLGIVVSPSLLRRIQALERWQLGRWSVEPTGLEG